LERWRRRPYDPTRPAIVLNIPEFRLRAFSGPAAGPDPELEMKIVVGEGPNRKTPALRTRLETIVFRPPWTVRSAFNATNWCRRSSETAPGSRRITSSLVNARGEIAAGGKVSESQLSALRAGELILRQKPGPKNVLGLVMFRDSE